MTLNLLFVTVTIKLKNKTMEQYQHEENVSRLYDEYKNRQTEIGVRVF
jgi:uncharacterized protein (TIGR02413 family)